MSKTLFSAEPGKQITVFLENRPGTLSAVIETLRASDLNMRALSLSEGLDVGYLRIIADKHDAAVAALKKAGHMLLEREVVLLTVANKPGGLSGAIKTWADAGINVEYAYSADDDNVEQSLIVARVNDIQKAIKVVHSA